MIDRHILLLRVNALIGGIGADDREEALQLTAGIPEPRQRAQLAGEISGYLLAIRMASDGQWDCDPRPEARAVLAKIEAAHGGTVAAKDQYFASRRPLLQRTAGSLRRLIRGRT